MPPTERERFDRDGYLIIPGALAPDEVRRYAEALDRVYATATTLAGGVPDGAAMHQLSAVANCPEAADLLDRRLWHARSDNRSPHTRKAMFFGYTFPWVAIHYPTATPLYSWLKRRDLLEAANPPLKP